MSDYRIDVIYDRVPRSPGCGWIRSVIRFVLSQEKVETAWQAVLLTDNQKIRRLNRQYLKHDYATDVIAFWTDRCLAIERKTAYLGDLVVSVQRAKEVSGRLKIGWKEELARYLIHGSLHLIGYTDSKPKQRDRMIRRQESLLKKLRRRVAR